MKRGWIILKNGERRELPAHVVDQDSISWPLGFPEKEPARPVSYVKSAELYRRHEVVEGETYVFLVDSDANAQVPDDLLEWVMVQLKSSPEDS